MNNKHYYPTINLLRGIAALMVCVYHFTNFHDYRGTFLPENDIVASLGVYGVQGVFVFFVITGFVIPLSLFRSDFKINRLPRFLGKRWIRIEIPYLVSIFATLFVWYLFSLFKDGHSFSFELGQFLHHIFYSIPFAKFDWYNPIYWTLAIEFQFYILIALVYPFLVSEKLPVKIGLLLLLAAIPLFLKDNRLVFQYIPIFAMGISLFWYKTKQLDLGVSLGLFLVFSVLNYFTNGLEITITGILTTAVIGLINVNYKVFNRLGDISYSLYLIHGLIGGNIIYLYWGLAQTYNRKLFLIGVAVLLSMIGAYIFWWLFERPSKKWSKKIGKD